MAKKAGHCLSGTNKCTLCGLRVNFDKNLAYLECILNMKCFGRLGNNSFTLHSLPNSGPSIEAGDTEHYIFHGVRVHQSHAMATHWDLELHFCTFCGAYSQHRSKYLSVPCGLAPSKHGREALVNILAGKRPDRHYTNWKARQGPKLVLKPKALVIKASLLKRIATKYVRSRKGQAVRMASPVLTCQAAPPGLASSSGACAQCRKLGGLQLGRCICDDIALAELNGLPFSVGQAKEQEARPHCSSQGLGLPSPPVQVACPLACPKHRYRKTWTIDDYCRECDALALAALASTGSQ